MFLRTTGLGAYAERIMRHAAFGFDAHALDCSRFTAGESRPVMSLPPRLAVKLNDTLGPEAAEDLVTWLDEMHAEHAETRADFAELRRFAPSRCA